jgi:hypothetical protein
MRLQDLIGLAAVVITAGCATLPQGNTLGALKRGGFAYADAGVADQSQLQSLVAARLASRGLTLAPTAGADYIVYLGLSALPARAGLYRPDPRALQTPPRDWVVDPHKGKKLHLDIVVLDRASGAQVFEGGATLTGPGRHDPAALTRLIDAALGETPKP